MDLKKSSKGPASATSVATTKAKAGRQTTIVQSDRFITRKDTACIFEECQSSFKMSRFLGTAHRAAATAVSGSFACAHASTPFIDS